MGDSNGADNSAESMDPQTLEHDCGQPASCSSGAASARKTDTSRSIPSETADECIQNRSSWTSGEAGRSFKETFQEEASSRGSSSSRRGKASKELNTGDTDVGYETREIVFSKAESTTKWYKAIEGRDCKNLMELLKSKGESDLLLKTGEAGRTALHVAAMQICLELANIIERIVDVRTAAKLTDAIDGRCNLTARQIARHILGYKYDAFFNVAEGGRVSDRKADIIDVWEDKMIDVDLRRLALHITKVFDEGSEKGRYKGLMDSFETNVDYNFYDSRLFLFHHACSGVSSVEFLEDVLNALKHDELDCMLMRLRDLQGRTPWHVAVAVRPLEVRDAVIESLVRGRGSKIICAGDLGERDGRGWTPVHVLATQPWSDVLTSSHLWYPGHYDFVARNCPNSVEDAESTEYCNAIHLAVLHNNVGFVESTGSFPSYHSGLPLLRRPINLGVITNAVWCPFTLAMVLGNLQVAKSLLARFSLYGGDYCTSRTTPICLAATLGNTSILRQLLNNPRLDPFATDSCGQTSLHYAANGLIDPMPIHSRTIRETDSSVRNRLIEPRHPQTYIFVADVPNVAWLDARYVSSSPQETQIHNGLSGRQGCITILQAGLDMWQKDKEGRIAEPGVDIIDEVFINWWHEKIAKETLELRNSLNQGGNAIAVIGALIATASFVGPLQPPLNYGPDSSTLDNTGYAHVWDLPVRIFMMSNSLSFYLAIASIMLAVVPSLPMPQESIWNELKRTRKTVALAICVLLLSVIGILVSYAAASIAVMPKHTSFTNVRWTSSSAVVGGFACLIGIVLFTIRVLRLMYPAKCRWLGKVWENVGMSMRGKLGGQKFREMVADGIFENTWSDLLQFVRLFQ